MESIRIAVEIPEFEGIDLTDATVATLEDVLADVATERGRQVARGFGPEHDDAHSFPELEAQIQQQLLKAATTAPAEVAYRERLVQVAAVAVAAIESYDRRREMIAHPPIAPSHGGSLMLTRGQILEDVREIIRAEAGLADLGMVQPGSRLAHELKTDTLCLLNVYGALEQHFGVEFSMLEMAGFGFRDGLTVSDLANAVASKLQPQPAEVAA